MSDYILQLRRSTDLQLYMTMHSYGQYFMYPWGHAKADVADWKHLHALAQAANESAWGTSRFATKGNNLFGQWCFSKGCGLVPRGRVEGASHEVAKFSSPFRSVRAYIQNLNRHPTYQELRDIRQEDRRGKDPLSGVDMAAGLLGYSERGQEYVDEIRAMIHYNNLTFYDDDFRDVVRGLNPERLQQLATATQESTLLPGQAKTTTASAGG